MSERSTTEKIPAKQYRLAATGRELLVLLFLALVALLPRLYQIESAPPGLNGDELFNAIDALKLGPGQWQVFFEGNNGREALFLYLMAVPLNVLGQSVLAIRLPAVLLGTGVVLLAYGIGTLAFNRRIGFVAGLLIAVSLWPAMQARWGLRAVSLTFFTALTIYLYLLAMRRSSQALALWIAAGLALGLTLYTYIPARIFPLVILAWFAWIAFTRRPFFGQIWRRLVLSLLLALIVFAPFGIYMVRYPQKVNQRIDSLQGFNKLEKALDDDPSALLKSAATVPLMFSFQGDTAARYHFDSRPVFDPLTSVFFYLGLATTIWLAFRAGRGPDRRSSYGLILLWMVAMLAPNLIVGVDTSFLRAAGAITPIYLTAAIGLDATYGWLRRRLPQFKLAWQFAFAALVAVGALATLVSTWQNYFNLWVNDDEVRLVYHAGLAEIGDYLAQNQPPPGAQLFIAYDYVAETTPREFGYYYDRAPTWFDHTNSFGWRPGQEQSWYFISDEKPLIAQALSKLQATSQGETFHYDDGDEAFTLYRLDAGSMSWLPEYDTTVEFVDGPVFIGFDMPEALTQGQQAPIVLHWLIPEGRDDLPNRLSYAELLLEDEGGNVWQRSETLLGYPEAGWVAGDRFVTFLDLDIPAGMPPGPIYLRFGLRDWQGKPYTQVGKGPQSTARSGPFLLRGQLAENTGLDPDMAVFGGQIALLDYRLSSEIAPGLPTDVALEWLALEKPADDYRVQLQLTDGPEGEAFYTETSTIWSGTYPPTSWQVGEQVTSLHRLHVPLEMPAVENPWLRLQLVPADSDIALPLSQGSNALIELIVNTRQHLFEMPEISRPLEVRFGDQIMLLGYELDKASVRPGDALDVILYWQAIETPSDGYTVFNHLVGGDGEIHGQFDGPPSGDAWYTAGWLPGEIIVDRRTIPVDADAPAGPHTLYIGLYNAGDGRRLSAYLNGVPQPDDRLPLTTVDVLP